MAQAVAKKVTPVTEVYDPKTRIVGVRAGAVVLGIGGLAVGSWAIWTAVSALFGFGLIALMVISMFAFSKSLPLLGQKLENNLLKARKGEARANPIEQLQNYLVAKTNQVASFRTALTTIGSQIKTMKDMLDDRKRKKPDYDATNLQKSIDMMDGYYKNRLTKLKAADAALAQVKELVEDKKFEWEFAQVGNAAMQSMNATDGKSLLDDLLAGEAFDSVRSNFNKVFAELEVEVQTLNTQKSLEFAGQSIDISAISIPELEPVRRK